MQDQREREEENVEGQAESVASEKAVEVEIIKVEDSSDSD